MWPYKFECGLSMSVLGKASVALDKIDFINVKTFDIVGRYLRGLKSDFNERILNHNGR